MTRAVILAIKEDYWRRRGYRDTVTGDMIYRAVLENGVTTLDDFERFKIFETGLGAGATRCDDLKGAG